MKKIKKTDVVEFAIHWDNHLDSNGNKGIQTISFKAKLNNGMVIYGNNLVRNPMDSSSQWGVK